MRLSVVIRLLGVAIRRRACVRLGLVIGLQVCFPIRRKSEAAEPYSWLFWSSTIEVIVLYRWSLCDVAQCVGVGLVELVSA